MSTPIPLPASLEQFVAYQEQLINRRLSEGEREATSPPTPCRPTTGSETGGKTKLVRRLGIAQRLDPPGPSIQKAVTVRNA